MSTDEPESKKPRLGDAPPAKTTWDDVDESSCSICAQRFHSKRQPFTVCGQGHVTCLDCHSKVLEACNKRPVRIPTCSMCKQTFHSKPIRNIPLESTLQLLRFPCPNRCEDGRDFGIDEFAAHEVICPLQRILCPFPSCNLFLRPSDVLNHSVGRHGCGSTGKVKPLSVSSRGTIVECTGEGVISLPALLLEGDGPQLWFGGAHSESKPQASRKVPALALSATRLARTPKGEVLLGLLDVTHGDHRMKSQTHRIRHADVVIGRRHSACLLFRVKCVPEIFDGKTGLVDQLASVSFPVSSAQLKTFSTGGAPADSGLAYQFTVTLEKC